MQRAEVIARAVGLLLADSAEIPEGRRDRHARLLGMVAPDEGIKATETRNRDDIAALREVLAAAARWKSDWCAPRGIALWREGPQDLWMRVFLGAPLVFGLLNARRDGDALALFSEIAAIEASDRTDDGRREFILAELVALASRLRQESQANAYLERLLSSGRRATDGAIAQLGNQGDWRRAEKLLDASPRTDLVVTLIERLAPLSPSRAKVLLDRLERLSRRPETDARWCQGARGLIAHADPLLAESLARRVKSGGFQVSAMALAAARQPDPKKRETLFLQALTLAGRNRALRARVCAIAFERDPALGKALVKKAPFAPDPESAFWLVRMDVAQARKLLGAVWSREGVSDSEKAECATAMAALDANRALQMLGEIPDPRRRRAALLAASRYLFLTDAERKIVAFSDLFDDGDPLPTPIRGW
jgi:hypothetical protein